MEGFVEAKVFEGRIINVNPIDWTVDVVSVFDRKFYYGIQVGMLYGHFYGGEGVYAFPDVGAKCMVTIPSDSTPPYVSSFIMPMETQDISTPENPNGSSSTAGVSGPSGSRPTFAGGRPRTSPGSIVLKGRDNNFVTLHRGGVLQIGCSELCQSLYVPLNHLWMNISKNYAHHTPAGSILWGIQESGDSGPLGSEYTHTFRLLADTAAADVRIKVGKVQDPLPEPQGEEGEQANISLLEIDKHQIVCEMVVVPQRIDADTGDFTGPEARKEYKLKVVMNAEGGAAFLLKDSLYVATKKKMFLRSKGQMQLISEEEIVLRGKGVTIEGGPYLQLKSGSIKLGSGNKPVSHVGSLVQVTLPYTPVPGPATPLVLTGVVLTGEPGVMVLWLTEVLSTRRPWVS